VPQTARILTHCNAGALATGRLRTALGVIRGAVDAGKQVVVFADEDAPVHAGIPADGVGAHARRHRHDGDHDNMSGAMMRGGQVDLVVVGADRIAANGDVANKVGTYMVAVWRRKTASRFT
jgi:methylthioribose-1-phosphate isomerase